MADLKSMPESISQNKRSWTDYALIALGGWLFTSPLTFTISSQAIYLSDILSGLLLFLFGLFSLYLKGQWPLRAATAAGIWLQFAPLIFWAPDAISYLNDTMTGFLAILFSTIIPQASTDPYPTGISPSGWTFNPSSWKIRIPIITLCFICWFTSRYMASYQLGYLKSLWDPLFGDGTLKVITSSLSRSFPISDAGLGALVYTLEILMGVKGGPARWLTMPWMVIVFGIMVIPAGLVSILLIMSQPLVVGYWCGWCLITALCMLFMISLALDEVVAVLQLLFKARKEKKLFWKIFRGEESAIQKSSPLFISQAQLTRPKGISPPWNLIASLMVGGYLMFSPSLFELHHAESALFHIIGALVVTFSAIAASESLRAGRFFNLLFALALIAGTLFLQYTPAGLINCLASGLALIFLSFPRGKIHQQYGAWDRYIF